MKVWSALFNMIAVVIIAIMITVIIDIDATNARQFEEIRLAQAVDYAVEGAFRASIATDSIGTDYADDGLNEVLVNPTQVMDTFYNIMCMNYDMANSAENKSKIEQSVATAVLCGIEGYYVLEEYEVDNTPTDKVLGGEYEMLWGVKRPYVVYTNLDHIGDSTRGRIFAVNLINEKNTELIKGQKTVVPGETDGSLEYRATWNEEGTLGVTGLNRNIIRQQISQRITEDMNYAIHNRNVNSTGNKMKSFYLPSDESLTAVNFLESPSLILIFQDSTFLNGYDMDVSSVGGARVKVRSNVIGFKISGDDNIYYCYAGQQLNDPKKRTIEVIDRFDSLHEAAEAGFKPHFEFLNKPFGRTTE